MTTPGSFWGCLNVNGTASVNNDTRIIVHGNILFSLYPHSRRPAETRYIYKTILTAHAFTPCLVNYSLNRILHWVLKRSTVYWLWFDNVPTHVRGRILLKLGLSCIKEWCDFCAQPELLCDGIPLEITIFDTWCERYLIAIASCFTSIRYFHDAVNDPIAVKLVTVASPYAVHNILIRRPLVSGGFNIVAKWTKAGSSDISLLLPGIGASWSEVGKSD